MGLARNIERRLERLVDGLSSAIFRGGMPPVELAGRLVRQADLLVTEEVAGPTIPNRYVVRVNPKDLPDVDRASLTEELASALTDTAAERGWRTGGSVLVEIQPDEAVGMGAITCETESVPLAQAPWAHLIDDTGTAYGLADNRVVVGRSSRADVSLDQPEVSRLHAVIYRRSGGIWVLDLGSANGTRCSGREAGSEPIAVHAGDLLEFGPATFALRLV
ncbi:MAG TPA: DUF3662 and FHA domain-containing protein [Acidimicrobiia bacterium]|nr:DUF3662 and FHA domain-containing protein [Acidimicrobiia bacterium]